MRYITNFPIHTIDIEKVSAFVSKCIADEKSINDLVNSKNSPDYLKRKLEITETEFFLHLLVQSSCLDAPEDEHSQPLKS
jgi:hypothetical protein